MNWKALIGKIQRGIHPGNTTAQHQCAMLHGDSNFVQRFYLANTVYPADELAFAWPKPTDWSASTGTTGLANGYYYLYFTTADKEAGDTAPIATGMEIGVGRIRQTILQYGIYADDFADFYCPYANGMVGLFSIANANNAVSALVM